MAFSFNNRELIINVTINTQGEGIGSKPPLGKYKITNLYVDPNSGKQITEYDDTPMEE